MEQESKKVSLYTEAGICIDERVKEKQTRLFIDRHEAEKLSKKRKTYVYSAVDRKRQFVCFAVPMR